MRNDLMLLCSFFLLLNLNTQAQEGWLMQDGNPERTGFVDSEMKPPFEITQRWDIKENSYNFTYADGKIYFNFPGAEGYAAGAYDPMVSSTIWTRNIIGAVGSGNFFPAVSEDKIYFGGSRAIGIYALDRNTGDSLWLYPTESHYGRAFAIKGDRFFAQPASKGLICLQKDTGSLLWEYGKASAQTVPLVDDDHVYYTSRLNDTIVALTHDGMVVWKYLPADPNFDFESFISVDDTIFFKSKGHLVALNQKNGEEYWSTKLSNDNSLLSTFNVLCWTPEVLVVHEWEEDWDGPFKIQGWDKKTGQMLWNYDLADGSGVVATAFGKYLVHVNGGVLQIRNASDGVVIQEFSGEDFYNWARVIVVDGMILASKRTEIVVLTPEPTSVKNAETFPFDWKILGNPVLENLTIEITSENPENVSYRVIGIDGRTTSVSGKIFTHEKSRVAIDVSILADGNYILQLVYEGKSDHKVFFKTNNN